MNDTSRFMTGEGVKPVLCVGGLTGHSPEDRANPDTLSIIVLPVLEIRTLKLDRDFITHLSTVGSEDCSKVK